VICQAEAFQGLSWEALVSLAERFQVHSYATGQTIGQPVFLIAEGSVKALPVRQLIWNPATGLSASSDSILLQLSRREFVRTIQWFPELALELLGGDS